VPSLVEKLNYFRNFKVYVCIYIYMFQKVTDRRDSVIKVLFQLVEDINVALLLPAIKHSIKTIHTYSMPTYCLKKHGRCSWT